MSSNMSIGEVYDKLGTQYGSMADLPVLRMEWQLFEHALGDCTGKTVLDLGGGSGLHARQAIDHGALSVDNIDVSTTMLEQGKSMSTTLGRDDPIRWMVGDMSKSLDHLGLKDSYDIILVGWTFDHAESDEQLEDMWRTVSRYARPGARLINTRMASLQCPAAVSGRYAIYYTDIQDVPGGYSYTYHAATQPIFSCPATTMRASMDFELAKACAERHGFIDYQKVPSEQTKLVKDDPEFWRLFVEEPMFVCVTATKKA